MMRGKYSWGKVLYLIGVAVVGVLLAGRMIQTRYCVKIDGETKCFLLQEPYPAKEQKKGIWPKGRIAEKGGVEFISGRIWLL
jgi:hypothetical protein